MSTVRASRISERVLGQRIRGRGVRVTPDPLQQLVPARIRTLAVSICGIPTKQLADLAEIAAEGFLRPMVGLEIQFSKAVSTIAAVESRLRAPGRGVLIL